MSRPGAASLARQAPNRGSTAPLGPLRLAKPLPRKQLRNTAPQQPGKIPLDILPTGKAPILEDEDESEGWLRYANYPAMETRPSCCDHERQRRLRKQDENRRGLEEWAGGVLSRGLCYIGHAIRKQTLAWIERTVSQTFPASLRHAHVPACNLLHGMLNRGL